MLQCIIYFMLFSFFIVETHYICYSMGIFCFLPSNENCILINLGITKIDLTDMVKTTSQESCNSNRYVGFILHLDIILFYVEARRKFVLSDAKISSQ